MTFNRPRRDLKALLHPDELRSGLLLASLYVLAYESFKDGVIDHLRILHFCGIDESGWMINEAEYRRDVLSRDKHPLRASLLWFHEYGAISDEELDTAERLRATRNRLVHELWKLLGTDELAPLLLEFNELIRLYRKIEVWRIVNLEVDGDPAFDGQEINEEEIVPGPMMFMRMLLDVALGDDETAWSYYHALMRQDGGSEKGADSVPPAT